MCADMNVNILCVSARETLGRFRGPISSSRHARCSGRPTCYACGSKHTHHHRILHIDRLETAAPAALHLLTSLRVLLARSCPCHQHQQQAQRQQQPSAHHHHHHQQRRGATAAGAAGGRRGRSRHPLHRLSALAVNLCVRVSRPIQKRAQRACMYQADTCVSIASHR